MKQRLAPKYGLGTTISLVIGCVIGSGIFFKVDDILIASQGNSLAGLIGWVVVGLSVVLGAISLAYYAILLPNEGGLIKYTQYRFGNKSSFFVGWFYMCIYYPLLGAVLYTVAGIYIVNLLKEFMDFTPSFIQYTSVGFFCFVCLFFINIKKPSAGALIQGISTVIKVIPLALIAGVGIVSLFKGDVNEVNTLTYAATHIPDHTSLFALASATFIPIAFTFDGWYVATQVSGEVINPKRNLPLALITGTSLVLVIYVFYYLGIVFGMGSDGVIAYGDAYIAEFARNIASDFGAIVMQIIIIISVLGAGNAILIGALRVPYQLVNSGNSVHFLQVLNIDKKTNMPLNSAYLMFGLYTLMFVLYYFTSTLPLFVEAKFELSNLPITFMYLINLSLYVGLFKLIKLGKFPGNKYIQYIVSVVAIFGAIIVLYGGITTSNGLLYITIVAGVLLLGTALFKK
ncbi:MAG: APC family permease [Flavobacteriaceae bacterium]|nr:APC family permease [Flavobacteriaceae bacterium]